MRAEPDSSGVTTYFAPPERANPEDVQSARLQFLADRISTAVLEGIPDPVLVVNSQRQIVACNSAFLQVTGTADAEELLGMRPGEAAKCVHCEKGPGGCGTAEECVHCGAVNAVLDCLRTRQIASRECRLRTASEADGGVMDFLVRASFVSVGDYGLVVAVLRDISAEKRRGVLERVFFHDVLNTASGIFALAWMLSDERPSAEEEGRYRRELRQLSAQIAEEIGAQRQLLAAERGELELKLSLVSVPDLLGEVVAAYRDHNVARERSLELRPVPAIAMTTDATVLRRVLGNLIKNALEAADEGATVTVSAERCADEVTFIVRNPGVMPDEVQRQIFHRSFSTKGGDGRGIGTHSVKLLTERYLGGRVRFVSTETEGTVFTVTLPAEA
jgi:hypothetical protein